MKRYWRCDIVEKLMLEHPGNNISDILKKYGRTEKEIRKNVKAQINHLFPPPVSRSEDTKRYMRFLADRNQAANYFLDYYIGG